MLEAEWVSDHGQVKEATLWSAHLATCERRATVIGTDGLATLTEEDDCYVGLPRPVRELGASLLRSGRHRNPRRSGHRRSGRASGGLLDPHIAYDTLDMGLRSPFSRASRIVEELVHREKQLKAALRARDISVVTIKNRVVEIDPTALRRRLWLFGTSETTLVLTRRSGAGVALLVEQL